MGLSRNLPSDEIVDVGEALREVLSLDVSPTGDVEDVGDEEEGIRR